MTKNAPGQPPLPARRHPPAAVSWRSWPLKEGGRQLWPLVAAALPVAAAAGLTTGDPRWALVALALLAAAAWRFFVPEVFEVNAQGIYQEILGRRRRIPWRAIECCEICGDGLFLSRGRSPLALLRGSYVPWGDHRAEVLALVDYYLLHNRHEDRKYDFEYA